MLIIEENLNKNCRPLNSQEKHKINVKRKCVQNALLNFTEDERDDFNKKPTPRESESYVAEFVMFLQGELCPQQTSRSLLKYIVELTQCQQVTRAELTASNLRRRRTNLHTAASGRLKRGT
ncbi:hypothetical protein EVAR_58509_1 [Eumeta japonica]|uniref:Uncharacterized protein n=1 Tax=Eumeta variegata TaxID=151549 RepID=A0A4C1ZBA2_EUMVA|nr:hypothetical protein EVAR_58509_1 [Eumeta japonica]